ncbi:hypothetical protein AABB24_017088, partial [Solanum stoloniferum]
KHHYLIPSPPPPPPSLFIFLFKDNHFFHPKNLSDIARRLSDKRLSAASLTSTSLFPFFRAAPIPFSMVCFGKEERKSKDDGSQVLSNVFRHQWHPKHLYP